MASFHAKPAGTHFLLEKDWADEWDELPPAPELILKGAKSWTIFVCPNGHIREQATPFHGKEEMWLDCDECGKAGVEKIEVVRRIEEQPTERSRMTDEMTEIMDKAIKDMNGNYDKWTLRFCMDRDSVWWEAESEGSQRIQRARLTDVVKIARILGGKEGL